MMPYADKALQKKAQNAWYLRNKEITYARNQARRTLNKQWLNNLKQGKPCLDCNGLFAPVVMDFHHRDPTVKEMDISRALITRSRQFILDEIEKCDLICANCHRLREYGIDDLV